MRTRRKSHEDPKGSVLIPCSAPRLAAADPLVLFWVSAGRLGPLGMRAMRLHIMNKNWAISGGPGGANPKKKLNEKRKGTSQKTYISKDRKSVLEGKRVDLG